MKKLLQKKLMTLFLAAGMLLSCTTGVQAIDFKSSASWLFGFKMGDTNLINHSRDRGGDRVTVPSEDQFNAHHRIRWQIDAVASEALSGTVFFEIGTFKWGNASSGGAIGADATVVKVKNAYLDWLVPDSSLKFRMGLVNTSLPNVAGDSAVMGYADLASVNMYYSFNENVGLNLLWGRLLNDNYGGFTWDGSNSVRQANYLDNIDIFMLSLPMQFEGFDFTPWLMYGIQGKNAMGGINRGGMISHRTQGNRTQLGSFELNDTNLPFSLRPYESRYGNIYNTSKAFGNMFWVGLPLHIKAFDPFNIEIDINYGNVEGMGRYDVTKYSSGSGLGEVKRGSTQREGWLVKALFEYKTDWGVPGLFGWYASGDDGNIKNGSERMPTLQAYSTFTSFLGDGNYGWIYQDYADEMSGSWAVGLQLRDVSFMDDLKHTLRVMYMNGTNSTSMVKYMPNAYAWTTDLTYAGSPYLTEKDALVEVNFVNDYKIYENLNFNLELSYIANFMDSKTWRKAGGSFDRQDAWKVQGTFEYSF